ncbi:hypothetical protein [Gayadomonas joobiniege]|uniref:hypothetical protein n=1 Tax=Gayadomonas joobiniege TaxID=1234606 RepID=UPI00037F7B56|nr:hypothetical protein [Gayadomonas joobiniege]
MKRLAQLLKKQFIRQVVPKEEKLDIERILSRAESHQEQVKDLHQQLIVGQLVLVEAGELENLNKSLLILIRGLEEFIFKNEEILSSYSLYPAMLSLKIKLNFEYSFHFKDYETKKSQTSLDVIDFLLLDRIEAHQKTVSLTVGELKRIGLIFYSP